MLMTILTFLVFASKAFCNGEDGAQPVDEQDTAQNATFCKQHQSAGCEQPADEPSRVSNFMSESMKEFQIQIEDLYTSLMEALSKILFPGGETVNGGSVAISKHINYVFLYATLICTTVSVIILASYYFSNAKEENPLRSKIWPSFLLVALASFVLKMIGVMIYLKSLPFNYSFTKALGFNIPLTFHHIMLIDVVMVISVAVLWTARRDLLYFNLRQKRKQTFFLTVIFSLLAYGLVASLILLTPVNASFLPKLVLVISLLPLLLELGARMFYTPIKPGKKIYEMANAGEYGKNTPSYHSKQFVSTQEFLNNIVNNPPNALNVEATMY